MKIKIHFNINFDFSCFPYSVFQPIYGGYFLCEHEKNVYFFQINSFEKKSETENLKIHHQFLFFKTNNTLYLLYIFIIYI